LRKPQIYHFTSGIISIYSIFYDINPTSNTPSIDRQTLFQQLTPITKWGINGFISSHGFLNGFIFDGKEKKT
jgi:hypothetical protein